MSDAGEVVRVDLPDGDFRKMRYLLGPDAFGVPYEDPDFPATDLIPEESWSTIMTLPTDVAIRASSHFGSDIDRLRHLYHLWLFALPTEPEVAPYMNEAIWLASDELDAAVFICLHGYYRQAFGCLRNALELVMQGCSFALRQDEMRLNRWLNGKGSFGIETPRRLIASQEVARQLEEAVAPLSMFGPGKQSWVNRLYMRLSAYGHSSPGFNNVDFWDGSNGPVHRPTVVHRTIEELREVLAFQFVLLRLGWAGLELPEGASGLYLNPGPTWAEIGPAVFAAQFA